MRYDWSKIVLKVESETRDNLGNVIELLELVGEIGVYEGVWDLGLFELVE